MSFEKCKFCYKNSYPTDPNESSYKFDNKEDWTNWIALRICPFCYKTKIQESQKAECFRCGKKKLCKILPGGGNPKCSKFSDLKPKAYCPRCDIVKIRNAITREHNCLTCKESKDIRIKDFRDYLSYKEYTELSGMCQKCQDSVFNKCQRCKKISNKYSDMKSCDGCDIWLCKECMGLGSGNKCKKCEGKN